MFFVKYLFVFFVLWKPLWKTCGKLAILSFLTFARMKKIIVEMIYLIVPIVNLILTMKKQGIKSRKIKASEVRPVLYRVIRN